LEALQARENREPVQIKKTHYVEGPKDKSWMERKGKDETPKKKKWCRKGQDYT